MKKLPQFLLTVAMLLSANLARAYDVKVDGICYNLDKYERTARVTEGNQECEGDIVIPSVISNDGTDYTVTGISYDAFKNSQISKITIPNTVLFISDNAFESCKNLRSVEIPASVMSIGNGAFKETALTRVDIPNSITEILGNTFAYCSDLEEVILPNTITLIGGNAFYGCTKLKKIEIPNSIWTIGSLAFSGCKDLKEVYVYWDQPLLDSETIFDEEYICDATLYVPQGSTSAYKQEAPWNSFGKIVEYLPGAVENINSDSRDLPCEAFNLTGVRVAEAENLGLLEKMLDKGIYVVRFSDGNNRKLIVE